MVSRKYKYMTHESERPAHRAVVIVFWLSTSAALLSFNNVANMVVGSGWFITAGLACCCTYLIMCVRTPLRQSFACGRLFVAAAVTHVVIGWAVTLMTGETLASVDYRLPFRAGLAVMVAIASASCASIMLRRIGVERLLAGILAIQAVGCIAILATPLLLKYVYSELGVQTASLARFRFIGTFTNPNIAAMMACQTAALALTMSGSGRYRKVTWAIAILAGVSVYLTRSKSGIFILFAIALVYLWCNRRLQLRIGVLRIAVSVICIFTIVTLSLNFVPQSHRGRAADRVSPIFLASMLYKGDDRFKLWLSALRDVAEAPVVGKGFSSPYLEDPGFRCSVDSSWREISCSPHNTYLAMWRETGIIPVVILMSFIFSLLRTHLRLPKSVATNLGISWTIALALEGMTYDHMFYFPRNAVVIGLSCALAGHVKAKNLHAKASARGAVN